MRAVLLALSSSVSDGGFAQVLNLSLQSTAMATLLRERTDAVDGHRRCDHASPGRSVTYRPDIRPTSTPGSVRVPTRHGWPVGPCDPPTRVLQTIASPRDRHQHGIYAQ